MVKSLFPNALLHYEEPQISEELHDCRDEEG